MPQLEPLESLGRKLPGVIEDTHRACHWVLGTRSEARGTRPSSFFDLLRPSSTFFVLLHPSSSFFNLLHLSSTFFILLRPSSSFFILPIFPFRAISQLSVLLLLLSQSSCPFPTFCAISRKAGTSCLGGTREPSFVVGKIYMFVLLRCFLLVFTTAH